MALVIPFTFELLLLVAFSSITPAQFIYCYNCPLTPDIDSCFVNDKICWSSCYSLTKTQRGVTQYEKGCNSTCRDGTFTGQDQNGNYTLNIDCCHYNLCNNQGSSNLGALAILGIVIGTIIVLALVGTGIAFVWSYMDKCCRHKNNSTTPAAEEDINIDDIVSTIPLELRGMPPPAYAQDDPHPLSDEPPPPYELTIDAQASNEDNLSYITSISEGTNEVIPASGTGYPADETLPVNPFECSHNETTGL